METILALQAYLQASETTIDVVLALFFGWVSFMLIGYLIEQRISKDEQDVQKQFDWEWIIFKMETLFYTLFYLLLSATIVLSIEIFTRHKGN